MVALASDALDKNGGMVGPAALQGAREGSRELGVTRLDARGVGVQEALVIEAGVLEPTSPHRPCGLCSKLS